MCNELYVHTDKIILNSSSWRECRKAAEVKYDLLFVTLIRINKVNISANKVQNENESLPL
jgi:hypothetical protein